MTKRDEMSEAILGTMSAFTFALLTICPGGFLWFFLPPPFGIIAALACGCVGPAALLAIDKSLYGPRP